MILYNEFEPFTKLVNSEFYNDFEIFSKLVHENGNENENENGNVSTNKILGSLEILAIKNRPSEACHSDVKACSEFFQCFFDRKNFQRP